MATKTFCDWCNAEIKKVSDNETTYSLQLNKINTSENHEDEDLLDDVLCVDCSNLVIQLAGKLKEKHRGAN